MLRRPWHGGCQRWGSGVIFARGAHTNMQPQRVPTGTQAAARAARRAFRQPHYDTSAKLRSCSALTPVQRHVLSAPLYGSCWRRESEAVIPPQRRPHVLCVALYGSPAKPRGRGFTAVAESAKARPRSRPRPRRRTHNSGTCCLPRFPAVTGGVKPRP